VGDIFAWFFEHGVPDYIHRQARQEKKPFAAVLEKRAAALRPGESGLLALDWWNGNRSILVDVDLTGVLLGMTLATRAEEIYRTLIEATAFGTRTIVEAFDSKGIRVEHLVACGGLPEKNQLLMQIYADVTGRDIKLADPLQTCSALGSAMHGAVAAGSAGGGYDTIAEAARHMAKVQKLTYKPRREAHKTYSRLYNDYHTLHDYFGRGSNDVMKRLKEMKRSSQ
jgi:L-ribulokinase